MGTDQRRLPRDGVLRVRLRPETGSASALLVLALLACTPVPDRGVGDAAATAATTPATWAAAAEAYVAAYNAAYSTGITNVARFYAPDAHVDQRGLGYAGSGRAQFAQNTRDMGQKLPVSYGGHDTSDVMTVTQDEPPYLALDGFVDPATWDSGWLVPMASPMRVGPGGIEQERFAGSAESGEHLGGVPRKGVDPIVFGYLRAWASGRPELVAARYAPDARFVDSLQGVTATGAGAIGGLAVAPPSEGGLVGASLRDIPDNGGPAYYENGEAHTESGVDHLVLLMDVPGECSRAVAAELQLDAHQRIVREERFHRIDALRRCLPADELPHGWWDDPPLPDTPTVTRTGTVSVGLNDIAVWDGDPARDQLIAWALGRFAHAGLPPRQPTSVTFLPDVAGDPWSTYGFLAGSNAPDIGVPAREGPVSAACANAVPGHCAALPASAKLAMLHELAHLWLTTHPYSGIPRTTPAWQTAGQYAARHLLAWADASGSWSGQAGELAAETVAWGLMDEPTNPDPRMGKATCADLTADFELLTMTTADPRACADAPSSPPPEEAEAS